jgi:hypothetical protein
MLAGTIHLRSAYGILGDFWQQRHSQREPPAPESILDEACRFWRQHVERARYESDLAQRRFLKVDPDNRLVADTLEADWNEKLRSLAAAQDEYEKATVADANVVTDAKRAELMSLATDFPRLWRDPRTQMKEKKRMLRLLIEIWLIDVRLDYSFLEVVERYVLRTTPKIPECFFVQTTPGFLARFPNHFPESTPGIL